MGTLVVLWYGVAVIDDDPKMGFWGTTLTLGIFFLLILSGVINSLCHVGRSVVIKREADWIKFYARRGHRDTLKLSLKCEEIIDVRHRVSENERAPSSLEIITTHKKHKEHTELLENSENLLRG